MRRPTRGIGLFGGPGAMMSAKRIKAPPRKAEVRSPEDPPVAPAEPAEPSPSPKSGWLHRLFGSDDDPAK